MRRYRRDGDLSYALGMALAIDMLLAAPEQAVEVYVSPEAEPGESLERLLGLCRACEVPSTRSRKAFNMLSPKGNCYAIGVFRKFHGTLSQDASDHHIVLVSPSDAGNLGTVIRTAVGFGMPDIAVVRPAVDFFDPKAVRASMGAVFRARVAEFEDFAAYRESHPGRRLYPFMLGPGGVPLAQAAFAPPFALVFGNEAAGLPQGFRDAALLAGGAPVVIPHSGAIDSLNLTVAAGIGMYAASCLKKPPNA